MNAEILSVGTELLLGGTVNTDARDISLALAELGVNVYWHTVVGDNPARLTECIYRARNRADLIITTGGLGPTCDDLTKQTLARAFDRKLYLNEDALADIREYFAERGRSFTDNNLRQAYLPEGSIMLPNDCGTAPGCIMEEGPVRVVMLPGPPRECEMMFKHRAVPYLRGLSDGVIASRTVKTFGIGESAAESVLRDLMNALHNPTLAPYAQPNGTELRITAHADTEAEALALIAPVEEQVKERMGHYVIGVDVDSLEAVCFSLLQAQGLTLGTAESCTGGLIAKLITDRPGSSAIFRGGIVSYTNEVKHRVLGVPQDLLDTYGAVSPQVAEAMARGAKQALGCDIALSSTGVAGPDPDDRGNPIGLVYLGIAWGDQCVVKALHAGTMATRERVRNQAAQHSLDLLRRHLTGLPLEES